MRQRTTWNPNEIATRTAAMQRQADPYAMNQDHLKQQPAADKYLTGDPSTFAEDIHPNDWSVEYAGGQLKRNEIGMPEMRRETFNHPEKTAATQEQVLVKKADLASEVAKMMLRGRKFASVQAFEQAVEDQSVVLMDLPDAGLIDSFNRLATQEEEQKPAEQQQQQASTQTILTPEQLAANVVQAMSAGNKVAAQQAVLALVQATAKKANDQQGQGQQGMQQQAQGQQQQMPPAQAQQQMPPAQAQQQQQMPPAQAQQQMPPAQQAQQQMPMMAQDPIQAEVQQMITEAMQQQAPKMANQQGQQQQAAQQAQQQAAQQQAAQQAQQQAAQQAQQQAAQQQQAAMYQQQQAAQQAQQAAQQQQAQQQAQAGQQQQVQASDDQLLDTMLLGPGAAPPPVAGPTEMSIDLEPAPMDVGEIQLSASEDDVLRQLFAQDQEPQQGQGQGQEQAKQAARTAAVTLGTRPSTGVARIGGNAAPMQRTAAAADVNNLASLWQSAPDVREAFGLK